MEAYGIITKDKKLSDALRPKQCPNCNEPNKPDSKFCAKCRMVLTYDAYSETLESEKQKEDRVSVLEKQMHSLITTLGNLNEPGTNQYGGKDIIQLWHIEERGRRWY